MNGINMGGEDCSIGDLYANIGPIDANGINRLRRPPESAGMLRNMWDTVCRILSSVSIRAILKSLPFLGWFFSQERKKGVKITVELKTMSNVEQVRKNQAEARVNDILNPPDGILLQRIKGMNELQRTIGRQKQKEEIGLVQLKEYAGKKTLEGDLGKINRIAAAIEELKENLNENDQETKDLIVVVENKIKNTIKLEGDLTDLIIYSMNMKLVNGKRGRFEGIIESKKRLLEKSDLLDLENLKLIAEVGEKIERTKESEEALSILQAYIGKTQTGGFLDITAIDNALESLDKVRDQLDKNAKDLIRDVEKNLEKHREVYTSRQRNAYVLVAVAPESVTKPVAQAAAPKPEITQEAKDLTVLQQYAEKRIGKYGDCFSNYLNPNGGIALQSNLI